MGTHFEDERPDQRLRSQLIDVNAARLLVAYNQTPLFVRQTLLHQSVLFFFCRRLSGLEAVSRMKRQVSRFIKK